MEGLGYVFTSKLGFRYYSAKFIREVENGEISRFNIQKR